MSHQEKIEYLIKAAIAVLDLPENMAQIIRDFGTVEAYELALRKDYGHMNAVDVNKEYKLQRELDAF